MSLTGYTYLFAYLHTYVLTPWSRVLLEKLTVYNRKLSKYEQAHENEGD
jgi:hypothetical protein